MWETPGAKFLGLRPGVLSKYTVFIDINDINRNGVLFFLLNERVNTRMTSFSIEQIAKTIDAKIIGDASCQIFGLAPIATAKSGDLSFVIGGKYKQNLADTKASAVLLPEALATSCPTTALVVRNPELCFAKIADLFRQPKKIKSMVHPSAVIGEDVNIDASASVGANCVIGDHVRIGANTIIYPGTIIGDQVEIGENCCLYARVTLYANVIIGNRVIIHSGTVIGADGFGYVQDAGSWHKIPQLGGVVIGNDVEIGANTTIDCGALKNTVISRGAKIDNQVQVAHNVEIGEHSIIAGCSAIAGSSKIGHHCILGGSTNIGDHVTLADQVILTGSASVPRSLTKPGIYSSFLEVQPRMEWVKTLIRLRQLDDIAIRLKSVEKKQTSVEKSKNDSD